MIPETRQAERMREFCYAVDSGNVVLALVVAPFGYKSEHRASGFHFTILDGEYEGVMAVAPSLQEAVRIATWDMRKAARSASLPVSGETRE